MRVGCESVREVYFCECQCSRACGRSASFSPYGNASNIDVVQVVLGRAGLVRGIGEMLLLLLLLVAVSSPCLHAAAFIARHASRIMQVLLQPISL